MRKTIALDAGIDFSNLPTMFLMTRCRSGSSKAGGVPRFQGGVLGRGPQRCLLCPRFAMFSPQQGEGRENLGRTTKNT